MVWLSRPSHRPRTPRSTSCSAPGGAPGDAIVTGSIGRSRTFWAEAAGLAWALGVTLYTSAYFALYLCGVSGSTATWASLGLTLCGGALGLRRLIGARRREMMPA